SEGPRGTRPPTAPGATRGPGEAQRLPAGTGIRHSEFNASRKEPVHFLQIWVIPARRGLKPSYEQKAFPLNETGRLHLVASPEGRDGSLTLHQDVDLLAGRLSAGDKLTHALKEGRGGCLQNAEG